MKAKKWLTIITLICVILSVFVALFANYKELELAKDFSMAIFGSALLGFIMSLIEYFAERRNAMEAFLQAAYKVYSCFKKIKYIDVDVPRELILDCIKEEQHNELCHSFGDDVAKVAGFNIKHTKRDEYIEWIKTKDVTLFSEEDDIQETLVELYNKRIEEYKKLFMARMDMYLEISNIDISDLLNACGNLDFLFGNKSVRQKAFDYICNSSYDWRNKILSEAHHFNLLKEDESNFVICVQKLFDLNDNFFKVKTECIKNETHSLVYQQLFDDMLDRIEDFRCSTYFKKNVTYQKRIPVFSKITRKNISKENNKSNLGE